MNIWLTRQRETHYSPADPDYDKSTDHPIDCVIISIYNLKKSVIEGSHLTGDEALVARNDAAAATQSRWRRRLLGPTLAQACLLLPLGLFTLDAVQTYRQTLVNGIKDLEDTASILGQHAHNVFESYQLVLSLLDEHTRGKTWDELESSTSLHEYLAQLIRDYPQLDALAMIDANGNIRVSSFPLPNPPPNFADRAYFGELRDHIANTLVIQRVHSRIEPGNKLNIVRRGSSRDGTFDGVLLINVKPAVAFLDFWRSGPPDTITSLLGDNGLFLDRFPSPDIDFTTLHATSALFFRPRGNGNDGLWRGGFAI